MSLSLAPGKLLAVKFGSRFERRMEGRELGVCHVCECDCVSGCRLLGKAVALWPAARGRRRQAGARRSSAVRGAATMTGRGRRAVCGG